jgi:hypothetical protein
LTSTVTGRRSKIIIENKCTITIFSLKAIEAAVDMLIAHDGRASDFGATTIAEENPFNFRHRSLPNLDQKNYRLLGGALRGTNGLV